MGQGHSKKYRSRRYQFGEEPPPTGTKRHFTRRQQRQHSTPQQLTHHSQQLQQQQQQHETDQTQYRRRSSQDHLIFRQTHGEAQARESRPRPESWHDTRPHPFTSISDVTTRVTGNYRPNAIRSSHREATGFYATYESDSVTTMGYYSMDRREMYSSHTDASFVPETRRNQRSEVTEGEIELLVEELKESDWTRLGRHLGVSATSLATFRDRYHGNVPLCATEVLLLWKHNSSEVDNPRSQLALALSTIGREDLYGKIKRRVYIHANAPSVRGITQTHQPQITNGDRSSHASDVTVRTQDDWIHSTRTERSLERTESGVETVESLSDSLEDESDSDQENDFKPTNDSDDPLVIEVPITTSTSLQNTETHSGIQESAMALKPRSITVPIITTTPCELDQQLNPDTATSSSPVETSPMPLPPSECISPTKDDDDITSKLSDEMTVTPEDIDLSPSQISAMPNDSEPSTASDQVLITPSETVSIAILKSSDALAIDTPNMHDCTEHARVQNLQATDTLEGTRILYTSEDEELLSEKPQDPEASELIPQSLMRETRESNLDEITQLSTPINRTYEESSSVNTVTEITEDELHVLAGDIRSSSEWRRLGQRLGVTQAELKHLAETNNNEVTPCAFGVLMLWKQRHDNVARERHILASVISDLGRDDLYSAILKNKLVKKIRSIEASLQRWKEYLNEIYVQPIHNSKPIHVDLVYRDKHGSETKLSSRHRILNIGQRKNRQPVVVLYGDAGCGKTTLLRRLAQEWAEGQGESCLAGMPLVLLLNLQELRTCSSVGQAVVKYLLHKDVNTIPEMVDDFIKLYPDKVVLMLDGMNVCSSEGDLLLIEQIRRQTQCQIVVTSRTPPLETEDPGLPWSPIEIKDLSSDQRNAFIRSYFESDDVQRKGIIEYFQEDEILSCLCTRPMFLDITCKLWNSDIGLEGTDTVSDLLTSFLCFQFQTHEDAASSNCDAVRDGVKKVMYALSRIALKGLFQPTPVLSFKTSDLSNDDEREGAEIAAKVGLIIGSPSNVNSVEETSSASKESREWRFYHPLLQEKCAGIQLAHLQCNDPHAFEEMVASICSISEVQSLKYVLMFACNENVDAARRILGLLGELSWKESDKKSQMTCQNLALKCNFECHQSDALNPELQFNLRSLQVASFTRSFLTDVTLRYFIMSSITEAHTPLRLERVRFSIESRLDIEYVTACLQNGYFVSVPVFEFEMPKTFSPSRDASRRLSDDVIAPSLRRLQVSSILSSSDFISNLYSSDTLEELTGTDIDPKYIDVPAWCRNYPNLKSLHLSCVMYPDSTLIHDYRRNLQGLEEVICSLTELTSLTLSNFYASELAIQIITKAIQVVPKLSEVQIGPAGRDLEHYSEEIEDTCGEVNDLTTQTFIKAVKKSSSLNTLKLSCFGNFEKLYQLLRAETSSRGRRASGLQYSSDTSEDGFWVFKR